MKMKILCIIILSFILIYIIIKFVIPVKFSIKNEDIDKGKTYIVVEFVGATEEYWKVIDYSDDLKNLINKNPKILTRTMLSDISIEDFFYEFHITGNNKFVCYGKYTDIKNIDEDLGVYFYMYDIKDWDIIYPIKRNWFGFLPKSYLCNADFNGLF